MNNLVEGIHSIRAVRYLTDEFCRSINNGSEKFNALFAKVTKPARAVGVYLPNTMRMSHPMLLSPLLPTPVLSVNSDDIRELEKIVHTLQRNRFPIGHGRRERGESENTLCRMRATHAYCRTWTEVQQSNANTVPNWVEQRSNCDATRVRRERELSKAGSNQ
ncbi:hypothetical protein R3P38DRAFT_2771870 [Favolaschia claudopus]|uniref:Uncharacterized protein n=1 Tax=Favolaschia claudopus TaxID=2862362 RepID=A0AAW0CAB7_9AGAR